MQPNDIHVYYNRGREQNRLMQDVGQLEQARTREIILRYLPPPPLTIMDIGGGAGIYALWLAQLGYAVHLVDMMPLHIKQAQQAAAQPDHPLVSAQVGNALALDFAAASAEAVLLLGPLYHLPERTDRVQALREALRILKPGGLLFAATILRFASFLDGLALSKLADDYFAELAEQDLIDGQHRNPQQLEGYFATAFFHHPNEIRTQVTEAGFQLKELLAVEGPAGFMPNFEQFWNDDTLRERLLRCLRAIESDPTILGATGHLLAVGQRT
jgi:ubiquinone/menaquinone biosynthesis C-methylase UbiE